MLAIALYQPEIPPNTGNIIRLAANTGVLLHLIHPLGFSWEDKQLKRAGLDYHEWAAVIQHQNYSSFLQSLKPEQRLLACSTRGQKSYHEIKYTKNDILLLGPETQGLPREVLKQIPEENSLRIPMLPSSRSLNLANATAITVYEALRQIGFEHLEFC